MNVKPKPHTEQDYERFRELLEQKTGIVLGPNKHYLVQSRLGPLMREHNFEHLGELHNALSRAGSRTLMQQVIDRMTTNETLWFRDQFPFKVLLEKILPEVAETSSSARIWSAACSSGQEAYSISIAIEQAGRRTGVRLPNSVEIHGTDISHHILERAKLGCYQELETVRGLTPDMLKEFFVESGDGSWCVRQNIKSRTRFNYLNLLEMPYRTVQYDVIFCRNVLIYFSSEIKKKVIAALAERLKPKGYLFLGASESLSAPEFEMIRCNPGLVYQKR